MGPVPKVFSERTLGVFEAASASIPILQLNRAFEGAGFRLGKDPGGPAGARRMQFRRYVAGVDQHDAQQVDRLGDVLGALIEEVAASKKDFLVKAAERDGFIFADGAFRAAPTGPSSFAVTRVEDLASIDDRGRRLHLLANDDPGDAIRAAKELVESVCRTVVHAIGEPVPGKTADLLDVVRSTLDALEPVSSDVDDASKGAVVVRKCLQQLGGVVANLAELQTSYGTGQRDRKRKGLSSRHARLAAGAAVTFAGFIAETYLERASLKTRRP